jgi:hypothetical protein
MKNSFLCFVVLLMACAQSPSPQNAETIGKWGGRGVELITSENSSDFEFDCALANINSKIKTAGNDIVEQFGTYTYGYGTPIDLNKNPDVHPAKFFGIVEKDSMKITITILDQKRQDIKVKMKRDTPGMLFKCK